MAQGTEPREQGLLLTGTPASHFPRSPRGHSLPVLSTSSHFNTDLVAGICFPGLRRERRPGLRDKRTGGCPGHGPRGAEHWGMVRAPKLFLHALYLLDCLYPSPRTRRFCVAARCVRICAGGFWGSGEEPPSALSI